MAVMRKAIDLYEVNVATTPLAPANGVVAVALAAAASMKSDLVVAKALPEGGGLLRMTWA